MIKRLKKVGNSQALIIEKSILDILKINNETPLEVSTNGDVILIKPVREKKKQQKLQETLNWINEEYEEVLKKLAE